MTSKLTVWCWTGGTWESNPRYRGASRVKAYIVSRQAKREGVGYVRIDWR